jgi:hypothetical protein
MARILSCTHTDQVSLGDFIEHVSANVDRRDPDSIAAVAPLLRALANDRRLVLEPLHQQMREQFSQRRTASTQIIVLGGGSDFYVRVDIWPQASPAYSQLFAEQFGTYATGIGQSFPSLMTGYFGPGLVHDLYDYDPSAIEGYPGERVPLTFSQRFTLTTHTVALFLPHGEVVQRVAPESFSASLGLFIYHEVGDMHLVDVKSQTLREFPPQLPSSRRAAMLRLAGLIGDADTRQYLEDFSTSHPCWRTRLAASEALASLASGEAPTIWERACRDPAPNVRRQAQRRLGTLEQE